MNKEQPSGPNSDLPPELARPAWRALTGVGYWHLVPVAELTEAEVRQLHGIGPKTIRQLRAAFAAKGLSFAGETASPPTDS